MRQAADSPKPIRILGIETSTPNGGMALIDEERCLGSFARWGGRLHSQRVMTGLRDLLADLHLSPKDLTAVAVSVGPGSFTGVRVGLAAAKALAYGAGLPIIGIPTLEAFALRALGIDDRGAWHPGATVCPILDARRGEVYWAAFELMSGGGLISRSMPPDPSPDIPAFRQLAPDAMTKAARVGQALAALDPPDREFLVCGEGALHARAALREALGERVRFVPPHRMMAGPEEVAWLGLRRFRAGRIDDPMTLMPVYLREPDVQFPRTLQNPGGRAEGS